MGAQASAPYRNEIILYNPIIYSYEKDVINNVIWLLCSLQSLPVIHHPVSSETISPEVLKDKIAGGWAGKMIGVTYGAPTEFRAQGKMYTDSIKLETI